MQIDLFKHNSRLYRHFDDFGPLFHIDSGGYGQIFQTTDKVTKDPIVVKVLNKNLLASYGHIDHVFKEISCNMEFNSHFSVGFQGFGETEHLIYIALQRVKHNILYFNDRGAGSSLYAYMYSPYLHTLKGYQLQFFSAQICTGIDDIHKLDYIHRDIKPENILIDFIGNIRVIDFGFSKKITDTSYTNTICGTPQYMAPEVVQGRNYGKEVDWWAFGVLIYEMAFGEELFQGTDPQEIYKKIKNHAQINPQDKTKDSNVVELINGLVNPNKNTRFGCSTSGVKEIEDKGFFRGINFASLKKLKLPTPCEKKLGDRGKRQKTIAMPIEKRKGTTLQELESMHRYDPRIGRIFDFI